MEWFTPAWVLMAWICVSSSKRKVPKNNSGVDLNVEPPRGTRHGVYPPLCAISRLNSYVCLPNNQAVCPLESLILWNFELYTKNIRVILRQKGRKIFQHSAVKADQVVASRNIKPLSRVLLGIRDTPMCLESLTFNRHIMPLSLDDEVKWKLMLSIPSNLPSWDIKITSSVYADNLRIWEIRKASACLLISVYFALIT